MTGQSIVRKGIQWQVGNGDNIRIWMDKWIPTPSTYKVISPPVGLPLEAWVCELIDPNSGTWRTELVQRIFLPHEADEICNIALSSKLPEDKQVWAQTNNGRFTMRSAYKIAMELASESCVGAASDDSKQRRFWKLLWKINTPHKVRHFAWRACKDILPTKENLVRRKVLAEGTCEMCQSGLVTSGHLFWECERVREAWAMLKIFPAQSNVQFHSFMDMLWYGVFDAEWDALQIERMIIVAWALWTSRNEVRIGGVKKSALKTVNDALE